MLESDVPDTRCRVRVSKSNVIANYLGAAVVGLAPVLALPRFRAALGHTEFELLAIILLLQSLVSVLDAGASQALVRIIARYDHAFPGTGAATRILLHKVERIYWIVGACFAAGMLVLHPALGKHWFHLEVPMSQIRWTLCGAGLLVLCQFPGLFYRSLLIGSEQQVRLNQIMAASAVCRHGGAVALLAWSPDLEAYVQWNAVVLVMETLWRRFVARRHVAAFNESGEGKHEGNFGGLSEFNAEVWLMSVAAWVGAITSQMDKLLLSWLGGVGELGRYTLASYVSLGALQLVYPTIQAVWPSAVRATNDVHALQNLLGKLYRGILALIAVSGLIYVVGGHWLLGLWLHGTGMIESVEPVMSILLIGTALNALYNVGYLNWVANGAASTILRVNLATLAVVLLVTPWAILRWGASGAAVGWVSSASVGLVCSLWQGRRQRQYRHA